MDAKPPATKNKLQEDENAIAIVSPEKKKIRRTESANENAATEISADTVMGFPKHRNATNRELINHYDFVKWAKKKYSNDEVYGRLEEFCDWLYSPEGQQIEQEYLSRVAGNEIEQANKRFTYGKHEGRTFKEIAENDPSYHTRYIHMLRKKNEVPTGQLARYVEWFNKAKKSGFIHVDERWNAARDLRHVNGSERFTFGMHRGETFRDVAERDPSYHPAMGNSHEVMDRYIQYFNAYGDHAAAHEGEMDTLAFHAGISRPCWYGDYDSDDEY
jgi:uncharacterized protein (DUF3820 family)